MLAAFFLAAYIALWTCAMGVLGLPLLLVAPMIKAVPLWFSALWARGCLLGFRATGRTIEYRGTHNIPNGAAIIASQHQSALETLAYYPLLDRPAYILKRELYGLPVIGQYLAYSRMIAINRNKKVSALQQVLKQAEPILKAGRKIVIFPEGTRVPITETRPYNKSVYKLYELGYPVVPVALNSGKIWPKKALRLGRGKAIFSFLSPMPQGLTREQFMQQLRTVIETENKKL